MTVSLFNAIPAGAIEVLSDATGAPHFKRADLGRFLGIVDMRHSFENVATKPRSQLIRQGGVGAPTLLQSQNNHDVFVDLDAALEIVVRSRKPKAVELTKWLTRKGVEKVIQEHQKAIEEKDTQLALLNDDLTESHQRATELQELVRQLDYNNMGLQGEIRAKDQEIARRETECVRLRERYVDHCQDPGKDNVVIIIRKHTGEEDDDRCEYPYYIARIQRHAI